MNAAMPAKVAAAGICFSTQLAPVLATIALPWVHEVLVQWKLQDRRWRLFVGL